MKTLLWSALALCFLSPGCASKQVTEQAGNKTASERIPTSSTDINFTKLSGCFEVADARFEKYLGVKRRAFEQAVNAGPEGIKQFPEGTLEGPLEFRTIFHNYRVGVDGPIQRHEGRLPFVNGILIYPLIPTNGYDNFIPGGGLEARKMLSVDFRKLPAGTVLKLKGKKVFLYSEISMDCRNYGESLMVTSYVMDGKAHRLTNQFPGPLPKNQLTSENPSDLFVLMGTKAKDRWYDPLKFFMDRTLRIRLTDDRQKQQVLTAWLHPLKSQNKSLRTITYVANVQKGNPWDPNWSFQLDKIEFQKPDVPLPEICDGNFGQIEAAYRSYRHFKISPLDTFCPWGSSNELVEIQDATGKALTETQIKERLQALGGVASDFVR